MKTKRKAIMSEEDIPMSTLTQAKQAIKTLFVKEDTLGRENQFVQRVRPGKFTGASLRPRWCWACCKWEK